MVAEHCNNIVVLRRLYYKSILLKERDLHVSTPVASAKRTLDVGVQISSRE
jgi:hypothetical protein